MWPKPLGFKPGPMLKIDGIVIAAHSVPPAAHVVTANILIAVGLISSITVDAN